MTYITKTAYLKQRATWRAAYAALSDAIRATKTKIKEAQRNRTGYHGSLVRQLESQQADATAAVAEFITLKASAQASWAADRETAAATV